MEDSILAVLKILGSLFLFCKFINRFARESEPDEVIHILRKSLAMRTGSFPPSQDAEKE